MIDFIQLAFQGPIGEMVVDLATLLGVTWLVIRHF